MAGTPRSSGRFFKRLESQFEFLLWKLRLVAILPVLMTAISSIATFVLGTRETLHALKLMLQGGPNGKLFIAEVLGGFVGGIDLYLIGIALLIFSYGTYELLVSAIDPARASKESSEFKGVLDVRSLDDLKEKLVKVLVVALLVFAFKAMLGFSITDSMTLIYYCLALLLLSLCAFLVSKLGRH